MIFWASSTNSSVFADVHTAFPTHALVGMDGSDLSYIRSNSSTMQTSTHSPQPVQTSLSTVTCHIYLAPPCRPTHRCALNSTADFLFKHWYRHEDGHHDHTYQRCQSPCTIATRTNTESLHIRIHTGLIRITGMNIVWAKDFTFGV